MPDHKEPESVLLFEAFILDTQIESPERCLIEGKGRSSLLSEIFAAYPELLQKKIRRRAEVYRQLGWEVPNEN